MSNLFSYRRDIDGLRAIAVFLVIFFHAKISLFSGGFIGVDVFFVISGFLITSIIGKEFAENRFTLTSFFRRRITRLMPAMVVLLLISTIPAYFILFPTDFENYSRTMIHSFLATNNFHIWITTGNYFSTNTDLLPLMHTWSLSMEEQFYLLWPPVLILMLTKFSKPVLIRVVTVLWFILLGLSIYLAEISPDSAYFLLPARAFELIMGAVLAITFNQLPNFPKLVNHSLSAIGLALILIPAFILNEKSHFPGLNAFWPGLGTVLLIISGKDHTTQGLINQFLSKSPLVFIGLISYSLYLWHWPIFVFIQYLGIELKGVVQILAIFLIMVIATLSWRFVEQPTRHLKLPTLNMTMKRLVLPSFLILTTIYAAIDVKDGFPQRFQSLAEFNKKTNFPNRVRRQCYDREKIGNISECWIGKKKERLDGVLIGDSYANHTAAFLDVLAKDAGLYLHDSASPGNPLLARISAPGVYSTSPQYAIDRLEYALQFDNIYLATDWDQYSSSSDANYNYILDTVAEIISKDINVFVITSLPVTTDENLHRLKLIKTGNTNFLKQVDNTLVEPTKPPKHIVNEMIRRHPQITLINMNDAMCTEKKCLTQLEDTIVYRNADHLNTRGAHLIAEKYLKQMGNPLKLREQSFSKNSSSTIKTTGHSAPGT